MLAAESAPTINDADDAADVLGLAISSLRSDDLDRAALLLAGVLSFVQNFVGTVSDAEDPRVVRLLNLWTQASVEASTSKARLHDEMQQQTRSHRASRAYA